MSTLESLRDTSDGLSLASERGDVKLDVLSHDSVALSQSVTSPDTSDAASCSSDGNITTSQSTTESQPTRMVRFDPLVVVMASPDAFDDICTWYSIEEFNRFLLESLEEEETTLPRREQDYDGSTLGIDDTIATVGDKEWEQRRLRELLASLAFCATEHA